MIKTVKQMIEIVERDGWYQVGQAGSHRQYKHPTKKGRVTIPDHGRKKTLDHMVVNSILKQAGLK